MTTWSLPLAGSHMQTLRRYGPAAAVACGCVAAAALPIADDEGQIFCPFRLATGGWCPGCGATRAFRAMTHADLGSAFALNPWAMLVLGQLIIFTTWLASAPESFRTWWARFDTRVLQLNLAFAVSVWILRMAIGQIPIAFI